jgi:hypothetical protein
LQLDYLGDEGLGVMDESSAHDYLGLLECFGLLGFGVGYSSDDEEDDDWFVSVVTWSPIECNPIIRFFYPILKDLRNHSFKEIGLMLGVDIGHIREDSIEVGSSFLLEVFYMKKI